MIKLQDEVFTITTEKQPAKLSSSGKSNLIGQESGKFNYEYTEKVDGVEKTFVTPAKYTLSIYIPV